MTEATVNECPNCNTRVTLRSGSECPSCGYALAPRGLEDHARNVRIAIEYQSKTALSAFHACHLAALGAAVILILAASSLVIPSTGELAASSDEGVLALRINQIRCGVYAVNVFFQATLLVFAHALLHRQDPPMKWAFRSICIFVLVACGCIFLMWGHPYPGPYATLVGASAPLVLIWKEMAFCFVFTCFEILAFALFMLRGQCRVLRLRTR
jgi:hypothetical protein